MQATDLWQQFQALPPSAQRQVADFIAFLSSRVRQEIPAASTLLEEESFVGIWTDRDELQDSSAWVRSIREQEWR